MRAGNEVNQLIFISRNRNNLFFSEPFQQKCNNTFPKHMFQQQRAYGAIQCGDGIVYATHLGKLNAAAAGGGDFSSIRIWNVSWVLQNCVFESTSRVDEAPRK